jgi:hypothetical protein
VCARKDGCWMSSLSQKQKLSLVVFQKVYYRVALLSVV